MSSAPSDAAPARPRRGRPEKAPEESLRHRASVRQSAEEHALCQAAAARRELGFATWARQALREAAERDLRNV